MKNKSGSSRTRTRLNGFSVRRIHHVCQRSIIILNTQLFYLRSIKAPQFEEVTPDLSLFCLCYADKTLHHRPTNSSYQQLSTCVCAIGGIEPPYLECIIVVLSREFIIYDAKRTGLTNPVAVTNIRTKPAFQWEWQDSNLLSPKATVLQTVSPLQL